jgi:hypothetical protein
MKPATDAVRLLAQSNPVAQDAFAGAADDSLGRATFERIIASPVRPARASLRPLGRRRLISLAAVAAAAVVVAGLLPGLLSGSSRPRSPRLTRPVQTAWEPARPLPAGASARGSAGGWRLASYLIPLGWREKTSGPAPGALACPTALTCYVPGNGATSGSGPADIDTMYVSYDGAQTWNALPVPAGITFTSELSCGSAASCAAGALDHGQPVLVSTVDGAHSWAIDPLPAADGEIFELSCPTATACAGLALAVQPPNQSPDAYDTYMDRFGVKLVTTTDGGRHFVTSRFPAGSLMQSLSCPTASHCVVLGFQNVHTGGDLELTTDDGGVHWSPGTLPADLTLAGGALTCIDASHCFAIGSVLSRYPNDWSGLAVSTDGGRTWTGSSLPAFPGKASVPSTQGLACASDTTCYASGYLGIPGSGNDAEAQGPPAVFITHDAGLTWSQVTFPNPSPSQIASMGDFFGVGDIQCPQADACIALGAAVRGTTPVYTYRGAP